ncbi:MAG: hypothetical protein OHK0040_10860 [bacterium]
MNWLYALIRITFLDGLRNKVAAGVIIFSVVSAIANIIIVNLAAQDVGKVAVDFALSSFSISGLFLILFACGNSIYRDIDKRTISLVLSRAVSRKSYIIGRFIGYLLFVLFISLISAVISILAVYLIKIMHIKHFESNFVTIFCAYGFSFIAFILLLSVLIFFSSLTTSSYTALLLTIMVYFIGNSIGDLRDFAESEQAVVAGFPPFFRYLLRVVHFLVPDLGKFDLKVFAANNLPLDNKFIVFSICYAIVYITILVLLSIKAFEKREFI